MKSLLLSVLTIAIVGSSSRAQEADSSCAGMTYENSNQVDYGPLKVATIRGTAKDPQGVLIPGACIGVFTSGMSRAPADHRLVKVVQTDVEGRFELGGVPKGEYRLVAKYAGLCSGNARIRVVSHLRRKKRIDAQMRPVGLDARSATVTSQSPTTSR